jgi:hypothetical protein
MSAIAEALPLSLIAGVFLVYLGLRAPRRSQTQRIAIYTACALVLVLIGCAVLVLVNGEAALPASVGIGMVRR